MSGFIGVLSLDTAFARIKGDAGHPDSYHMPARIRLVVGADTREIVRDGVPGAVLAAAFIAAAQALEAEGAVAITSTCGFLVTLQDRIAAAVKIPVMVSALSLYPVVARMYCRGPIGILTADEVALGAVPLAAAGIAATDVRIAGMQDVPAFANTILRPRMPQVALDPAAIELAVIDKARALLAATPALAAFLLECGNLPPYANAIAQATGRPVWSILDGMRLIARPG